MVAAGALLLARFDAWGNGLIDVTVRLMSADDWRFRAVQSGGIDFIELAQCMCAPSDSASGMQAAALGLLVSGFVLSILALPSMWRTGTRWSVGTCYLFLMVQGMSLLVAIPLSSLAAFDGVLVPWVAAVIVTYGVLGVNGLTVWRDLVVDGIGRPRPLLSLR